MDSTGMTTQFQFTITGTPVSRMEGLPSRVASCTVRLPHLPSMADGTMLLVTPSLVALLARDFSSLVDPKVLAVKCYKGDDPPLH